VLLMQPIQVKAYRLIARGKAHNVTLIACARKLLVYANTVLQRGTPWADKTASA
jgi:transposase